MINNQQIFNGRQPSSIVKHKHRFKKLSQKAFSGLFKKFVWSGIIIFLGISKSAKRHDNNIIIEVRSSTLQVNCVKKERKKERKK
jgi:hypothetical protein